MSHCVTLFIGRGPDQETAFRRPPFTGSVELGEGLIGVPLDPAAIDLLNEAPSPAARIDVAGRSLSKNGPVVFVATDYFGGPGTKDAAAWIDGQCVFQGREVDGIDDGPIWLDGAAPVEDALDEAIVRAFGWPREETGDAFAMIGLGNWRHTHEIIEEIRAAQGWVAPVGVVLAGGKATRMGGGDKCLLPLGGRRVLDHVLERLGGEIGSIALNANGDAERFAEFGQAVIPDSVEGFAGPLAGVLAGLDWAAAQGASHIVTVAGDTPFFPRGLVEQLVRAGEAQGKPIVLAATSNGRHPTFGLWPVDLRDDLRSALETGTRKVVAWTDRHGTATAEFADDPFDPFFNINTPEDLDRAEELWAMGVT